MPKSNSIQGVSFDIYDAHTIRYLTEKDPDILRDYSRSIDTAKDAAWNRKHINSIVQSSIVSGESLPKIAQKMGQVVDMDRRASYRTARTAMTAAQNGGRLDAWMIYKDAGIDIQKQWMATLDMRTRHSHAYCDGETRELEKPFSNGCLYPGDPNAEGSEIYNCRCTLVVSIPEIRDGGLVRDMYDTKGRSRINDMTYEQWKQYHLDATGRKGATSTVQIEAMQAEELPDLTVESLPSEFSRTKMRRENIEAFLEEINGIDGADPLVREMYSSTGKMFSNFGRIGKFDVRYADGAGCVSYSIAEIGGRHEVRSIKVSIPKMSRSNISGTSHTTAHEIGHFIDAIAGLNKSGKFLSSKYSREFDSLGSAKPSGRILEEIKKAEKAYSKAILEVDNWYDRELKAIRKEYDDSVASGEGYSAYKEYVSKRNKLKNEYKKRSEIESRIAMEGIDGVEDIFDALNGGMLRGMNVDGTKITYGHGPKYYSKMNRRIEETFANYCSISILRPDIAKIMREDMPELFELMDKVRDDILGGI